MRKALEWWFDLLYLVVILGCGAALVCSGRQDRALLLLGMMALLLGIGDMFHLIPRMAALGREGQYHRAAGLGKWVTSVTSGLYYLLLYSLWRQWHTPPVWLTAWVWALFLLRIVLCCLPCNRWLEGGAEKGWAVVRNVPFLALGLLLAGLFLLAPGPRALRLLPYALLLSMACYLPVVVWGEKKPALGMLMMPKTLCYVWIACMGLALGA